MHPSISATGEGDAEALKQVAQDFTKIDINLERPTVITIPQGEVTVSPVRIWVDDTDAFLTGVLTYIP